MGFEGTSDWLAPLGNVVTRHHAAIRFVLTQSVVCNRCFQSPELRKHSGVGLKPCYNVADWLPLSLVKQAC